MRTLFLATAAALLLSACGTMPFHPTEYPLRDGLIHAMPVKGDTKIVNAQPSSEATIVYSYGGTKLSSDLHAITETMVQQAGKELAKAAKPTQAGAAKTIEVKVISLESTYIAFFWKSKLSFEAKLGNGKTVTKTVAHSSGSVNQDLNGCIAESVMTLLNDDEVRAYLAE